MSLFTIVMIGFNVLMPRVKKYSHYMPVGRKLPLRIEFKYILFHKRAFHQLINSRPENTMVSMWGKLIAAEQ